MANPGFAEHAREIRDFEQLMVRSDEIRWVKQYRKPGSEVEVLLYLGCNVLRTAHIACEAIDVFEALGVNFVAVAGPQFCCGIVHQRVGDLEGANRLVEATVSKLESYEARQIVIWCPTCLLRFEETASKQLTPELPQIHATAFLAERVHRLPFRHVVPARVAVHTHVGAPQREMDARAAIRVLEAVPGVEVVGTVSSPDLDYHCAPPLLKKIGLDRFRSIRDGLAEEAKALGADTLVTPYHSCHREWCEIGGEGLAVRNYISIVAESLGCGRHDYFQQFKKLGNADEIASLARRMWESHRVGDERAREIAARCFGKR